MKLAKHITPLIIGFAVTFPQIALAKAQTSSEYEKIVSTTYNYFEGLHSGNQSLLNQSFDMNNGYMKSNNENAINSTPLRSFAKKFTEKSEEQWHGKILSIDIVDDKMAFVKFDFDTPKIHYIDYLLLLKSDNDWLITSKAYVAQEK
ncbi:nuclear transport factor 2 family protein [Vibrio splendidus]|uniref:nuclear transport factor 2 family protein n=1 Tax=Vibrio splendidus TaxID=29497 RepID=UPI001FB555A0|nr:nuclear transport factor 2 family protein [Vibrio splendidus]UOE89794.1 nuclear transport factor 2 family protein [Vibrio splendidus]